MKILIFDIEANSLTPDKIHCMSYVHDFGDVHTTVDYNRVRELLTSAEVLIGHNIIRWDIPVLERLLDIKIKGRLIDTLALSWYLYPKRSRHGLENWGVEFGTPKPPVVDWENEKPEVYQHRCEEDVKITAKLWEKQQYDLHKLYEGGSDKLITYLMFKMDCAREQERSRWKLDKRLVKESLKTLHLNLDDRLPLLVKVMPKVPIIKVRKRPAKPYKKDGTRSCQGVKWLELLEKSVCVPDYEGKIEEIVGYKDANPISTIQVKAWLFSLGWVPSHYKYLRDKETNKFKKIPQVKSEREDGTLCDSVMELVEKEEAIRLLSGLGVMIHRISFLEAMLTGCSDDGWVKAEIRGLTNTLRFKHSKPCANIPGLDKPWGKDIRGCFIAKEGYELCGSDAVSLENNTKLHYMYDWDPEYVKEQQVEGFDPHLDLAVQHGVITQEEVVAYVNGDDALKSLRRSYKTVNYAATYGVQKVTLSRQLKSTKKEAQQLLDVYWERNKAIRDVVENTITKKVEGQMWLFNPVSELWYSLRAKKDVFSTLNQGTGVYCFDTWVKHVRKRRSQLTAQFHDEIVLHVRKGHREVCNTLLQRAAKETNRELNLNVPFNISIDYGETYANIH